MVSFQTFLIRVEILGILFPIFSVLPNSSFRLSLKILTFGSMQMNLFEKIRDNELSLIHGIVDTTVVTQFGGGWPQFKIIANSLLKVLTFCKLQSFVFIPEMITIIRVLCSTIRHSIDLQQKEEEKIQEN
jgi:hypothetical protein